METMDQPMTPPASPSPTPPASAPKRPKMLIIAAAVALVAVGILYALMREQSDTTSSRASQTPRPTAVVPAGWQSYQDSSHGFTVYYPDGLAAGAVAPNSVLGTAQNPVGGTYVGPLVVVPLTTDAMKKSADAYFDQFVKSAQQPGSTCQGVTFPVARFVVHCEGEGGPATYAYIMGDEYDLFIDGYSRGYSSAGQQLGDISNADEDILIQTLKVQ